MDPRHWRSTRDKMERLVADLSARLKEMQDKHGFFRMDIAFGDVAVLVGQVRLALKHPDNTGHAAERAKHVLQCILTTLELESPGITALLNTDL